MRLDRLPLTYDANQPGQGLEKFAAADDERFAGIVARDLAGRVGEAMRTERARPSNIGGRLPDLVRSCGFELVAKTASTQSWNAWNPDESPAPDGCFSMSSLADDLIEKGQLSPMFMPALTAIVGG